jgi:hypothetical protein
MLDPLTHPLACLIYFIALGVGIRKLLGDPASPFGFLGRAMLFAVGSLAVSASAVLSWSYQQYGPPEALISLLFIPAMTLLVPFLGMLAAALTARPRAVFPVTLGAMSAFLFLALLALCPY